MVYPRPKTLGIGDCIPQFELYDQQGKEFHEQQTKEKLQQFDNYLNEFYINDMINQSKNNNTM